MMDVRAPQAAQPSLSQMRVMRQWKMIPFSRPLFLMHRLWQPHPASMVIGLLASLQRTIPPPPPPPPPGAPLFPQHSLAVSLATLDV